MKKLVIVLSAMIMAVAVQAATCSWVATAISTPTGMSVADFTAYLLDGDTISKDDMVAALNGGDVSKLTGAGSYIDGTGAIVATATPKAAGANMFVNTSRIGVTDTAPAGIFTTGDTYDFYMVIIDNKASQYMVATKDPVTLGSGALSMGFGDQSSNTWNKIEAVPEPTSGLLLLVGGALLALRRKQK